MARRASNRTANTPRPRSPRKPRNTQDPRAPQASNPVPPRHQGKGEEKVGLQRIRQTLEAKVDSIDAMIPSGLQLGGKRLITNALHYIVNDRRLWLCQPSSVLYSVMGAAKIGLDFIADHAYLRVNAARDREGEILYYYASFIAGYQGLVTVLGRNGVSVTAQAIYEHDVFEPDYTDYAGTVFRPARRDRGELDGAVAFFRNAADRFIIHMEYMTRDECEQIARRQDSWAWQDHPAQMYRKSPIIRGFKLVPKVSDQLAVAQALIQRGESGDAIQDLLDLSDDANPDAPDQSRDGHQAEHGGDDGAE